MCGIIGMFNINNNKEAVNEEVINQLEDQKTRGMEGFGAILITDKLDVIVKRATTHAKLLMDLYQTPSRMIILHHRMPTSSLNRLSQTHPILVKNGSLKHAYLVVHNGIISNDDEVKKLHEEMGFVYTTAHDPKIADGKFNDSEALAIEVARFIEKQTNKIEVNGSATFIALQFDPKTNKALKVFFGTNRANSLNMAKTRDIIRLSSEGKGGQVTSDLLYQFDFKNFKLKKEKITINFGSTIGYETTKMTPYNSRYTGYSSSMSEYDDAYTVGMSDTDLAIEALSEQVETEMDIESASMIEELSGFEAVNSDKDTFIATHLDSLREILKNAYEEREKIYFEELTKDDQTKKDDLTLATPTVWSPEEVKEKLSH